MSILRILALGVLVAISSGAPADGAETPQPVAIVYLLAGDAWLTAPDTARRPLRLPEHLPAKTTVEVGPGSRLMLAFVSGLRYELGERSRVTLGPGDFSLKSGPVRPLPRFPPLPLIWPIAAEDNPGLRAGAVRIPAVRIRTESVRRLYPDHGAATLAEATVLRFEPVESAGKYRVEVQDSQGKVAFTKDTTTVTLDLPKGVLQPGMRYVWTIRTLEREGAVAQGKAYFVTLSAKVAEEREALRKALEAEGDSASLALLAEIDRSLGLLAEARDGLQAVINGSPGETGLTETLAELERRLPYRQSP